MSNEQKSSWWRAGRVTLREKSPRESHEVIDITHSERCWSWRSIAVAGEIEKPER